MNSPDFAQVFQHAGAGTINFKRKTSKGVANSHWITLFHIRSNKKLVSQEIVPVHKILTVRVTCTMVHEFRK